MGLSVWGPPEWVEQLARLTEYQVWHQPASSVALWWERSEKGLWPLLTFLSRRKLFPSSHLDTRHFGFSLYTTGAFQAATLVLQLRGNKSECGFFKGNFLELQKFLPPIQSPLVFADSSYGDLPP